MNTNQCDIGLIGLAVMGENLALNLESKGFSVAVFNRTTEVTEKFAAGRARGKNIQPTRTIEEFVDALKKPRIAMMMIKAGKPVDIVIGEVAPLLERGDVLVMITDGIDGWVASKQGTTRSGAFLDPLADKVMVLGAMWALVASDRFAVVPVAIITVRELGIQAFRSYWGRLGLSVPASWWAKVKTVVQEVAVGLALLPWTADTDWLLAVSLWLAVVLTLATGVQYLRDGGLATRLTGSM